MSTLPKSWILTTIDEIYSVIGGGTPPTNEPKYWNGEVPWITSADITENGKITPRKNVTENGIKNSATNLVPSNSLIVVTRIGLGKVALCEYPLCFSQDSQALFGNKDFVYPKYAFYFLLQAVKVFKYQNRGTTISGVTKKQLKDLPFKLPPYHEQKRIVAKIEELFTKLDAGIEALKQVRDQLKRYRQSVLKTAVEGRLTAEWREQHKDELESAEKLLKRILKERREKWEAEQIAKYKIQGKTPPKNWRDKYKEPTLLDTSNLPELPEGWIWVSLETISESLGGFAFKSKDYSENGYQVLKIGNVKMNFINLEKSPNYIKNPNREIIAKYLLAKNDVLITLTGTRRKRDYGFVAIVKDEQNLLLNQRVARLKFSSKVNPDYYSIALQSEEFRDRLFANETGNVGQGNIGIGAITEEAIPLPTFYEQLEIINEFNRLSSILDNVEIGIESELKRSQSLRQSILKRAFDGKLVPQEPNDEPASVLLERIKTEKVKSKQSQ